MLQGGAQDLFYGVPMSPADAASPLVDVIIAVHSDKRPIDRAVRSALRGGIHINERGGLRITVVCHNIPREAISAVLSPESRAAVTLLECRDDSRTCAAPRNRGMDVSTARYISFLDSDDTFQDGALANWVEIAERYSSAAVLAMMVSSTGRMLRSPAVRPGRRRNLDPVRDRLARRTPPMGLLRRSVVEHTQLRFDTAYLTGEDVATLKLWLSGERIDLGGVKARYIVHDDAGDRVSKALKPLALELAPFVDMLESPWFSRQDVRVRRSFAHKVIHSYLFDGIRTRLARNEWGSEDTSACRMVMEVVSRTSPGTLETLARADINLLSRATKNSTATEELKAAWRKRRRYGSPETLFPPKIKYAMDREAPLRYMTAAALLR